MLSQLVYISDRKKNCTEEEIEKILMACKKNNADLDVTGVLLYSKSKFLQYLEGDYKKVMDLYEKIKKDERHEKVIMLSCSPIEKKIFPSWEMGTKKFSGEKIDFQSEVSTRDREVFQSLLNGNEKETARIQGVLENFFK